MPCLPRSHIPHSQSAPAFLASPLFAPLRLALPTRRARYVCTSPPCAAAAQPATGADARRLAKWLAAQWANKQQAMDAPTSWAHIHITFRPLPWTLLRGYAFYCESAYDYNLGLPYKSSVVLIVRDPTAHLELASYKLTDADEFWMASTEPHLLDHLTADRLLPLPEVCNAVYQWDDARHAFIGSSRPGKACRIRRGGKEKETYLDSKLMLTEDQYCAWDLGRCVQTDELVWGPKAGPFIFSPLSRMDHLVPEEPSSVFSSAP